VQLQYVARVACGDVASMLCRSQENREREMLEREVVSLREENSRLYEESQIAANQLRRFSGWFFNNIDKR